MAITQRLQQGFLRLPFARKVLLVSSAAMAIAPVFPWYDFRNRFGVGDSLNGLEGPLFVVGWLVMGMGAVAFFNMFFPLLGRNFFELKKKSGLVSMMFGAQSLLLLVVANTVFFHPSYSDEASRGTLFGMMLALGGSLSLTIFGAWVHRGERNGQANWGEESVFEPVHSTASVAPVAPTPHFEPVSMERTQVSIEPVSTPYHASPAPVHATPNTVHAGVDPLTLDAKTRYRLMQSQMRRSMNEHGQGNMWGSQPSSHSSENSNSLY